LGDQSYFEDSLLPPKGIFGYNKALKGEFPKPLDHEENLLDGIIQCFPPKIQFLNHSLPNVYKEVLLIIK